MKSKFLCAFVFLLSLISLAHAEGDEFNQFKEFGETYLSQNSYGDFGIQEVSKPLNLNDDTGVTKDDYVATFSANDGSGKNVVMLFVDHSLERGADDSLKRVVHGPQVLGSVALDFKTVSKKNNLLITVVSGAAQRKFTLRSTDRCNSTAGFSLCLIGVDATLKDKMVVNSYSVNLLAGLYNGVITINGKKVKSKNKIKDTALTDFGSYADVEAIVEFAKEPSVRNPLSFESIELEVLRNLRK